MDDKGSTLIICFGLPPTSKNDDPIRALYCAFELTKYFKKLNKSIYIGSSIGTIYAGIVGTSGNRREYSVLGESVNLAARHMSQVKKTFKSRQLGPGESTIFVDERMYKECVQKISMSEYERYIPKGYDEEKTA